MHPFLLDTYILGQRLTLPTGSLFTMLAVAAGGLVYFFTLKAGRTWTRHILFLTAAGVGALAGGKLSQFIIDLVLFPGENAFLVFFSSGSTIMGGLPGGIAGALLYRAVDRGRNIAPASFDALGVTFSVGEAIMRIGCLFTGCCFGAACPPSPFALTYPPDWIMHRFYHLDIPDGPRLPFPLIASGALGLIAVALAVTARRTRRPGSAASLFLILYGVYRFFIEFIRDEPFRLFLGPFSFAQWFSILCALSGCVLLVVVRLRRPAKSLDFH